MVLVVLLSVSFALCISCVVALAVFMATREPDVSSETGTTTGNSTSTGVKKTNLPVDTMLVKKKAPWNTQYVGSPERLSVNNGVLKMRYGKNAHGAPSGAKVSAVPLGKFPMDSIVLGYEVYFPESFVWKKGGKLPGVCLGTTSKQCATGGDWEKNEGSFRMMWRSKDNKTAYLIGYVYLPVEGHYQKAYNRQGPAYKRVTDPGERTGHDMWHGELPIQKGWNSVEMKIKLNTLNKRDGSVEVTVNGKTRRVDDIVWRDSSKVKISNINWVTFYGGGSNDWNSPTHETYTEYRNIYIA